MSNDFFEALNYLLSGGRARYSAINKAINALETAFGKLPSEADLNQLDGVEVGGNEAGDILTTDGVQTISGVKTFSANPVLSNTNPVVYLDADHKPLMIGIDADNCLWISGDNHPTIQNRLIFYLGGNAVASISTSSFTFVLPLQVTGKVTLSGGMNDGTTDLSATFAEINKAADGIGVTIPRQKIVEIGDWNMDSLNYVNVAHGLTLSKIVGCRCLIRSDSGNQKYVLDSTSINRFVIDATNVRINREVSGIFDGIDFDSTSYNRGWVILDYMD